MVVYNDCSDEELIGRIRAGEHTITDFLMEKYKFLVRKRANTMFLIGGENEDLIQEGMIGLFKAVRDYRSDKDSSFYHFADICISRQIMKAVEASQRKKHQPLNTSLSLEATEENTPELFVEYREYKESSNPELLWIARENVWEIEKKMNQTLSKMERKVIHYYLKGYNYRQIAEIMKKSPKTVDNALQRIKAKLSVFHA